MNGPKEPRMWSKNNNNKTKSDVRRSTDVESSISSDVTSDRSDVRMSSAVTCFDIAFHRESARFYEGEEMSGKVVLDLKEDMVIENLTLDFSGSASVEWSKRPRDSQYNSNTDTEKHLNQNITLYSRTNASHNDLIVPSGRHEYPFQVQLPYNLPSSFVGDHGSIRYRAKAVIERPWQAGDVTEREFTVISVVDLNTMPQILSPVHCHKASTFKLSCCTPSVCPRDNFLMIWRLDRTGFVPGEKIRINGEIHNDGITVIRKSMALFIQHVQYLDVWGHNLHERKELVLLKKGSIQGGHIGFWRDEMEIPPLPPSGLKGCNLMRLWYTLKLKVLPNGLSKPLETSIEITIGTVPISRNTSGGISTLPVPYMDSEFGDSETNLGIGDDYNYFV